MEIYKSRNSAVNIMVFVSAVLFISIYINPLASYSKDLGFILSSCLARLAAPFVFFTVGYSFFKNGADISAFVRKILVMYTIWTIVFNNEKVIQFRNAADWIAFAKKLVFTGVVYHLWIFPAIIFAVVLTYLLLKRMRIEGILLVSAILYVLGLLGESYYGITLRVPLLSDLYKTYLREFQTTCNGLFFGFFFVAAGAFYSEKKRLPTVKKSSAVFLISLGLLLAEIFVLRNFGLAKDFNMLLFLMPAGMSLSLALLRAGTAERPIHIYLRNMGILTFCIHLMLIRFYEWLKDHSVFLENVNSLGKFLFVLILSLVIAHNIITITKKTEAIKWIC